VGCVKGVDVVGSHAVTDKCGCAVLSIAPLVERRRGAEATAAGLPLWSSPHCLARYQARALSTDSFRLEYRIRLDPFDQVLLSFVEFVIIVQRHLQVHNP
jgi:hypothetical protein